MTLPSVLNLCTATMTDPRRDIEFRRGIKRGHEAPRDHVENFRFRIIEVLRFRGRRNDGEVIADLRVVEDALVEPHVIFLERLLSVAIAASRKGFPAFA